MSTITASHARALTTKHLASDETIFGHVRKLCDQHIIDATKLRQEYTYFTVPVFIFGLPIFKPEPMYLRLYHSLTVREFKVYRTDKSLELGITWYKPPPAAKKPSLSKLKKFH